MLIIKIENPLAFGIGLIGNFLSFMVFLAPVPTFYRVYKKKSTESFHSVPYIVALLSGMVWLYYATLTMDVFLLTINGVACIIESIYLVIYLTYAPKDARVLTIKIISLLNIACYSCLLFFTLYFVDGKRRVEIMGWISACLAVCVFVAPLSILKQVIKTRSVEYMPFFLSMFLTLSAIAWFCYGLVRKDTFVAVPNVMGFVFGTAQMILYFVFKATGPKNGRASISQVMDLERDDQADSVSQVLDLEKNLSISVSQVLDVEKDKENPESQVLDLEREDQADSVSQVLDMEKNLSISVSQVLDVEKDKEDPESQVLDLERDQANSEPQVMYLEKDQDINASINTEIELKISTTIIGQDTKNSEI